jgi:hypothetical protein
MVVVTEPGREQPSQEGSLVNSARLAQKPVSLLLGAAAGAAASALFRRGWRLVSGADDVPSAVDEHSRWGHILLAAALQGAVFAVVKAAVDRASATGLRRFTGHWPD